MPYFPHTYRFSFLVLLLFFFALTAIAVAQTDATNINVSVTCPNNNCARVNGCTQSCASNYNSLATHDDGSCEPCGGGGDPDEPVRGCTDDEAENYDSSAEENDGSCVYKGCMDNKAANFDARATISDNDACQYKGCKDPLAKNYNAEIDIDDRTLCLYSAAVPNVSNFRSRQDEAIVELRWVNPVYADLAAVIIVRSKSGIPADPQDGEIVYSGPGESYDDTDVEPNEVYYYTAFVKSVDDNYSSGSSISIRVLPDDPVTPPEDGTTPGPGRGGYIDEDGNIIYPTSTDPSPFARYEVPEVLQLFLPFFSKREYDFLFLQPEEPVKGFAPGEQVVINGQKPLTIRFAANKAPAVLKTIGITIYDPNRPGASQSYLLRINKDKTAYEALIGPFELDGKYPISIYIINYNNKAVTKYPGTLVVRGSLGVPRVVAEVAAPIALTTGAAAGLYGAFGATSFYDFYLLLLRELGALLGFFGLKRKRKPWGTVYDAVTKRPIDPAYVVVKQNNKEFTSAITDLDGRYGFFLPAGSYELEAQKTHYTFPSETLKGRVADELYGNLYFGGPVETHGEEFLNLNIPLDPVNFDWNEYMKNKADYFRFHTRKELLRARVSAVFYSFGLLAAAGYVLFRPGWFNITIFVVYLSIYAVQYVWRLNHRLVSIRYEGTGEPIPFALVRLYFSGIDQEVKRVVADQLGRFYVLVGPGNYYITIDEKQVDGNYRQIYRSEPMELKKGILEKDIIIARIAAAPSPILADAQDASMQLKPAVPVAVQPDSQLASHEPALGQSSASPAGSSDAQAKASVDQAETENTTQ